MGIECRCYASLGGRWVSSLKREHSQVVFALLQKLLN